MGTRRHCASHMANAHFLGVQFSGPTTLAGSVGSVGLIRIPETWGGQGCVPLSWNTWRPGDLQRYRGQKHVTGTPRSLLSWVSASTLTLSHNGCYGVEFTVKMGNGGKEHLAVKIVM